MAKVYVSSTVADLEAERKVVIDWLVAAGHQPVHSYRPSSNTVRDSCLEDVQACDLYVLILGHRYGFRPAGGNPDKLSITHLEYRQAKGKPRIALIRTNVPDEPLSDVEDLENCEDVLAFRAEVQRDVRAAQFHDVHGLIHALSTGLQHELLKLQRERPDWPEDIVRRLSTQLDEEFAFHLRAGENVPPGHSRAPYVRPTVKLRHGQPQWEGLLEDCLTPDGVQLLLIGSGGSGKTTLLKQLATSGAQRAVNDSRAPIFIYLPLFRFDRGDGGFDLLLDRLSLAARLDRREFEIRWRDGRRPLVLLLDGLNEVAQAHQPSCSRALQTLLQNSPGLHRYVIASRPGSELEITFKHSTETHRLQLADMVDFGPQQIREYLEAQGGSDVLSRISGHLEAMAANPFLLWAMARTLARSPAERLQSRGSLLRELIDRYIFQEREQSKPKPRPTDYSYDRVKKLVLGELALKMTEDGITVVTDGPALQQQIANSLLTLAQQREQDRELPLEPEVFMPKDFAAVSFLREVVDNGVVVRDGDGLRFMHEAVQEYFASAALDRLTVEDIVQRAPLLKLAQLDARGTMFETLVTWSGQSAPAKVIDVVECLQDKHPQLAAILAAEAGLPEPLLDRLRHEFLSLTASGHEQQRRLGAMGLAVLPSDQPEVLSRLIAMLHGEFPELAARALKAVPSKSTLSALVNTWLTAPIPTYVYLYGFAAPLLRELCDQHGRPIAEILLESWRAHDSQRDRAAEIAALVDATEAWARDRKVTMSDTLLILAVEAEVSGDLERSRDIDALRQRAAGKSQEIARLNGSFEWIDPRCTPEELEEIELAELADDDPPEFERQRSELAARYVEQDEAGLEVLVRHGRPLERSTALDALVARKASAAVAPVVEGALGMGDWHKALGSLPREAVQQYLAERLDTLQGERLERAQLLAGLLADQPVPAVLDSVFRHSDESLRILAAHAAGRAGAEGIEMLIEQLDNEASARLLEACVSALAESRSPLARNRLIDLLFERDIRRHWPFRPGDVVSDPTTGMNTEVDGWAALIHDVVANTGSADATIEAAERYLQSRRPGDALSAVHEARRCLPSPRAVKLLEHAMADGDPEVRRWAQLALGSAGHTEAWRTFLRTELDTTNPTRFYIQRRPDASDESLSSDSRITLSESVLLPALIDSSSERRVRALEITSCLPASWVRGKLRTEAQATAEHLLQFGETEQRVVALRALHRYAQDIDDRIFTILMDDRDIAVARSAYEILRDSASQRIMCKLRSAVTVGDCGTVRRIAERIRDCIGPMSLEVDQICDDAAQVLNTGGGEQCVAAMLALAILNPAYGIGGWQEFSARVRAAFYRNDLQTTWRRLAEEAGSLSDTNRTFVNLVVAAFEEELESLASLVSWATEIWPDDVGLMGINIAVDIRRSNRQQALGRLSAHEERLVKHIGHFWLGERFAELDRPQDALRHYRLWAEREPANAEAHFRAGWFAFVTGDLKGCIDSTRRSLTLQPIRPMAEFNLGLALLARRDICPAEITYRRGVALARRQTPAEALQAFDGAIGDFALLPELPDDAKHASDRIRARLQDECSLLRS
jgi:Domain of unknown function (DUF4062)/NACHT domain